MMPGTKEWCAPEWYPGFSTTDITVAKRMDVYSFGLLCAWMLFFAGNNKADWDLHQDLNSIEAGHGRIFDLVLTSSFSEDAKARPIEILKTSLPQENEKGCLDFQLIIQLLSPLRYGMFKQVPRIL